MAKGSGNLNDTANIDIKGQASVDTKKAVKSVDDLSKKVEQLGKNFNDAGKSAEQLEKILKKLDSIKTNIKIDNISGNQVKHQSGKNSVRYNPNDPKASKAAQESLEKIQKLYEQEIEVEKQRVTKLEKQNALLEKANQHYEEGLKIRADNAKGKKDNAAARKIEAPAYVKRQNAMSDWLEYRSKNPTHFDPYLIGRNSEKNRFGNAFISAGRNISGTGVGGRIVGDALSVAGNFIKAPAAGFASVLSTATKAVTDFSKAAISAYAEIESIKTNLSVVYATDTQANSAFKELSQYAVKSPFGVQQTSELAILLKQSGVYATDLMDTLKMLGDTAGGNMEKMKRIANNYAQIVSIGKASMLDMRQFAYAGIPIFEAVSKELNVSQQELRKLISDGKVTADIVEKVFKDLTGVNGIFENATAKGAETLKARLQNLKDAKQLMMSEFGDGIVNFGTQTGGDSFVLRAVSWTEGLYQGLQKWANGRTLERNIDTIANRNSRISTLEDLIKYNEGIGNSEAVAYLKEALIKEMGKIDIEKERATYNESYIAKRSSYEDYYKTGEERYYLVAPNRAALSRARARISQIDNTLYNEPSFSLTDKQRNELEAEAEGLRIEIEKLTDSFAAINNQTYTFEEIMAHRETNVIEAQQEWADVVNKDESKTRSLSNVASEIRQAMSKTEEAQKKAEEEQKSLWAKTIDIVTQISKNTDAEGNVDITKIGLAQLEEYMTSGAFSASKLNVVNGKSATQMAEDRSVLSAQYDYISRAIETELKKAGAKEVLTNFKEMKRSYNQSAENDIEFYKNFDTTFSEQYNLLSKELSAASEEQKPLYERLLKLLGSSTLRLSVDTSIAGVNIEDLMPEEKVISKEFIPLWKRILSQATGISSNVIYGTNETLASYRDDMAVRNTAANVFSAILKGGGSVDTVQSLLRTSGRNMQLRGDTGGTFQIDWKATNEAIKKFATQISNSTEVLSAYKSGLQAQVDVYTQLLSTGITSAESQDIQNKKLVSSAQWAELIKDSGDQLVNAFGERLTDEFGNQITKIVDGQFYTANGTEVSQESVRIQGNIFEFIKQQLPELNKNIASLSNKEINKKFYQDSANNKAVEDVIDMYINDWLSTSRGGAATSRVLLNYLQNPSNTISLMSNEFAKLNTGDFEDFDSLVKGFSNGDLEAVAELLSILKRIVKDSKEVAKEYNTANYGNEEYSKGLNKERLGIYSEMPKYLALGVENGRLSEEGKNRLSIDEQRGMNLLKGNNWFTSKETYQLAGFSGEYDIDELTRGMSAAEASATKALIAQKAYNESLWECGQAIASITREATNKAFLAPFETLGADMFNLVDNTKTADDLFSDMGDSIAKAGGELLSNMGAEMATAGFRIASASALSQNWAGVAGGLALAGAGGFAAGLGGAITNASKEKDKSDKETQKLENLKDQMVKLLEQARSDALYYENNLRHKTALGINKQFDVTSVGDAVIDPSGRVVTTAPNDWLFATTNPRSLGGGGVKINNIVNNNAGVGVSQKTVQNSDGSFDIITTLEGAIGEYIASPKSDEAFAARTSRMNGRRSIM